METPQTFAGKVAIVTGTGSGIGKACAQHLYERGYRVYGTSRHARWVTSISAADECNQPLPFLLIPMDVTDDASVKQGIEWVMAREGRIDVLVNNAGYGLAGAVEDTLIEEARAQLRRLQESRECRCAAQAEPRLHRHRRQRARQPGA